MSDHNAVEPLKGLAPYIGGKRHLAKRLAPMIDGTPHSRYVEPFTGMGGIFFHRRRRPKREVMNDLRGDVANLFRIVQRHPDALIKAIEWSIDSRTFYEATRAEGSETLTDVERAARFYLVQRLSFGGKGGTAGSGGSRTGPKRPTSPTIVKHLRAAHARLNGVTIECLDAIACIERFDSPDTLFYCDPPYVTHEKLYGKGLFCREDFECLADALASIKGRFILSIDGSQTARDIFGRFSVEEASATYSTSPTQAKSPELIVTGS